MKNQKKMEGRGGETQRVADPKIDHKMSTVSLFTFKVRPTLAGFDLTTQMLPRGDDTIR
jgi:hypothetical protein